MELRKTEPTWRRGRRWSTSRHHRDPCTAGGWRAGRRWTRTSWEPGRTCWRRCGSTGNCTPPPAPASWPHSATAVGKHKQVNHRSPQINQIETNPISGRDKWGGYRPSAINGRGSAPVIKSAQTIKNIHHSGWWLIAQQRRLAECNIITTPSSSGSEPIPLLLLLRFQTGQSQRGADAKHQFLETQ